MGVIHSSYEYDAAHHLLESLDTLTEIATRLFSSIPNRGLVRRPLITDNPWTEDQQQVGKFAGVFRFSDGARDVKCTIFVKTIKDKYGFRLTFTIPNQSPQYLAKPASFLAHLVAHEGPGSVFSYLKNKGWLLSISAGPQTWNRGIQLFAISGMLTHSGYRPYCNLAMLNRWLTTSQVTTSKLSEPSSAISHCLRSRPLLSRRISKNSENSQRYSFATAKNHNPTHT